MRRLSAILLAVLTVAGAVAVAEPASADTLVCAKFGSTTIDSGRYVVQNNVWGADTAQCINVTATGFAITTANHNKPTNGAPASYPSIYAGCHYANCSAGSGLPMQASSTAFAGVRSSVTMSYPTTGTWDAAYDLWFDPTPRTDGQNTGAEIMIWLNRRGTIQPVGSRVASVSLAGGTWDVWFGNIGWNVISYVRTAATTSIDFAVSTFYADAVGRGYAQSSWYLTSVQAGFEPWVGGTGLAVTAFSYTTTGSPPPPPPPPPGSGCRVRYVKQSEWGGGFVADITITNTGSTAINGWTLGFAFGAGQRVGNAWNAVVTQNGAAVSAGNVDYNRTIAGGGTVNWGFQGTWTGSNPVPASFALNGTTCAPG